MKPIIGCFGLAFKPNIDDLRESPALYIAEQLKLDGYKILAVEPNIKNHSDFEVVSQQEAIDRSDIFTMLVAHQGFETLDLKTELDFCGIL